MQERVSVLEQTRFQERLADFLETRRTEHPFHLQVPEGSGATAWEPIDGQDSDAEPRNQPGQPAARRVWTPESVVWL